MHRGAECLGLDALESRWHPPGMDAGSPPPYPPHPPLSATATASIPIDGSRTPPYPPQDGYPRLAGDPPMHNSIQEFPHISSYNRSTKFTTYSPQISPKIHHKSSSDVVRCTRFSNASQIFLRSLLKTTDIVHKFITKEKYLG
jgi:hypothetical protein